jgi:phosphatidylglycerol:prolipoprotein diacylglycerol transferase
LHPELAQIGAWTLRSYSIVTEIGIIVGIIVAYRVARRHGIPGETFLDMAIWTVIAGIVGSRLYYVAIAWEQERFYAEPIRILYSWEGGLVFQGAIVGAVLALGFMVRRHRYSFWMLGDIGAVGLAIGHAIGRWACFFEGCCYGEAADVPWAVLFPNHADPVHPTMIYESLANLAIFAVLWQADRRKPFFGFTFSLYLVLYSTVRFLNEFLRGDPAEVLLGLRLAQWVCLATIAAGVLFLYYLSRTASRVETGEPTAEPLR